MRLQLTVTHRVPSSRGTPIPSAVDVEVDAPSGTTAAELAQALVDHLARSDADVGVPAEVDGPPVLVVAGEGVDPLARVGAPPLLDGASVVLHRRNTLQDNQIRDSISGRTAVSLAVIGGPDCGRSIDLHPGVLTVGRSDDADVCLDDPSLSRLHAELRMDAEGVTVRDLGSTNGTRLDGVPVADAPTPVTTASRIHLGDSEVALRPVGAVPAATTPTGRGTLVVNRRPRLLDPSRTVTITLPSPPHEPRRTRVPWVAVLLPIPVAGVLALVVGPTMLAFALMGPVLMGGTALSDRWGARRTYAAELLAHEATLREAHDRVAAACLDEHRLLVTVSPDPATVLAIATGPTERLWERRRGDDDALRVTIGRCRRNAAVQVVPHGSGNHGQPPQLHDAPCAFSLSQVGVLGLCGDPASVAACARSIVGQLVTLHSPADLRVIILIEHHEELRRWRWIERIPHCRHAFGLVGSSRSSEQDGPGRPGGPVSFAALSRDAPTVHATLRALADTVRDRLADHPGTPWRGASTVLLIDGVAAFRGLPDLGVLLADGPRVGVVCLVLGADHCELPHEVGAALEIPGRSAPTLSLPGHRHDDLVVDGVGSAWSERLSRGLAPLRDATPPEGPAALPSTAGLRGCGSPLDDWAAASDPVDDHAAATQLAHAWQHRPHSTRVPLGVCSSGTFSIDLATDGPHLLVGGTTGAGKSELLRTLVASLALHNSPQHLSFVLVDYKGGAAFRDCADLPHVAGVVTDLDDQLAARALTSLTAEISRRERLLRDVDVTDFVSYQASPSGTCAPLARLVVVVDEFRALAEELPEFVDGLVHLAALGRSLGIHLILATQRPAGVVTADIKANVNLRIALRMRDRVDSEDVVDSPAAAWLDPATPGRAHARVGGSSLTEFQTAHVGAPLIDVGEGPLRIRTVDPFTTRDWRGTGARTTAPSELAAIVGAAGLATVLAGLAPAPAAWLPPLPSTLRHASMAAPPDAFTVHLGLVDVPDQQRQDSLAFDLRARGHWAVVGSPGSGRSSALLTVARSLCSQRDREELHVYAVSGGSLASLGSLPQVGASIDWAEPLRVERLLTRLGSEVAGRRTALALRGHTTMAQWWGAEDVSAAPPPILLLVDDWDLVAGRHDDLALATLVDRLLVLLREGEPVGVTAVLAGDRSVAVGRVGAVVSRRIVLRLTDPTEGVLLGLTSRTVAALQLPGRGLTSDGRYVQLALPPDPRPQDFIAARTTAPVGRMPLRVDPLPTVVGAAELIADSSGNQPSGEAVALGVGGDESTVLGLDAQRDGRRWLVTGAAASGVSTTLVLIARGLLAAGRPVAVVAPRGGPLGSLRGDLAVVLWSDDEDTASLVAARRAHPSLAVVVDTVDELLDTPVEVVLKEVAHLVDRDDGLIVVGANATALSSMYRGIALEVARHRTGVLLGPRSVLEGDVFGVRVPVDRAAPPGRGHVVRRGLAVPLQVALPPADASTSTPSGGAPR